MKKITLILLMLNAVPSSASDCHPPINLHLQQYIVGYGSLIDEKSKLQTDPTAKNSIPVIIKGYKRSWSVHGDLPGFNTTFLSIFEDQASYFNGVIYALDNPQNIGQYDKRERIYCRKELDVSRLKVYASALPHQKQIWIYSHSNKELQSPAPHYPIVQSYVDTFMRGCIQIEEKFKIKDFAKNCIETTGQWSHYWVNDRIFPRRPSLYEPYAAKIDRLLNEVIPEIFKQIKLEQS